MTILVFLFAVMYLNYLLNSNALQNYGNLLIVSISVCVCYVKRLLRDVINRIAYQIHMIKQDISLCWTVSMSKNSANSKLVLIVNYVHILFKSFCLYLIVLYSS